MTTPLEQLRQHVRPGGPAETPCPKCANTGKVLHIKPLGVPNELLPCSYCKGTGVIVSPQVAAIREALWEPCPNVTRHKDIEANCSGHCSKCGNRGYIRRSREQAALLLPETLRQLGYTVGIHGHHRGKGWSAFITKGAIHGNCDDESTPEDALSAAVLAGLEATP